MKITLLLRSLVLTLLCFSASGQEIGLQLYSLKSQLEADAEGTMAKVSQLGIREIEMKGTHGLSFPEFIKLLAVNNLSVISFEADFEKIAKFPQVVADEARSYGAKYVVCSGLPEGETSVSPESMDRVAQALNQAGKVMQRNGLLLCYQPLHTQFAKYEDGTYFDYLIRKMDTRFVHFEMDVFSVKQGGVDPVALLKKYPTRFVLIQLKDGKTSSGSSLVLGTGDVGIRNVMETARELGIQHVFIEDESSRADKQIPKSVAYVRSLNSKATAMK